VAMIKEMAKRIIGSVRAAIVFVEDVKIGF
jgi:hypothetical protein